MRLVSTAEYPADSIGEFVGTEQPLGLRDLAFAVNPLRLYRIQPRALGGQQTAHYPHSATAVFDLAIVGGDPVTHLVAFMPAGVVPDQEKGLFAGCRESVAAISEELSGYGAHRTTVHKPYPGLLEFGQIHPVAAEGLGLRVVLSRCLLDQARRPASTQECKFG